MINVALGKHKFADILQGFETESKLEEMLYLMLGDKEVISIRLEGGFLYREKNVDGETILQPVTNWQLSAFELDQFILAFKESVERKLNAGITSSTSYLYNFKEAEVEIIELEQTGLHVIRCFKK